MRKGYFQAPGPLLLLLLSLTLPGPASAGETADPAISIIIDDIGYRNVDDLNALDLPGPVTYAIMPHAPLALKMSELAALSGKEVILHLPMEAVEEEMNRFLGPGALKLDMKENQFISSLSDSLKSVPNAVGVNNHMGSLLTMHGEQMQWLMHYLRVQRIFYVDSVTSSGSVASAAASDNDVPYLKRDVFLDNVQDRSYIDSQFNELVRIARRKGTAVAIGHPHPETIEVLKGKLGRLHEYGIRLISLKEMISHHHRDKTRISLH